MKAYAAHALSHYMKENKDFVAYLDTKSEVRKGWQRRE